MLLHVELLLCANQREREKTIEFRWLFRCWMWLYWSLIELTQRSFHSFNHEDQTGLSHFMSIFWVFCGFFLIPSLAICVLTFLCTLITFSNCKLSAQTAKWMEKKSNSFQQQNPTENFAEHRYQMKNATLSQQNFAINLQPNKQTGYAICLARYRANINKPHSFRRLTVLYSMF